MRESLSVDAQQWFERQDLDATIMEWNVPVVHKAAFNELIRKGYLEKTTAQVGLEAYKFAPDIINNNAQGLL